MHICWIDLETTGTDERDGSIVEIGAIITDENLYVIETFEQAVEPDPEHWDNMPQVVVDMHASSGLTASVEDEALPLPDAERQLAAFMDRNRDGQKLILAGSGVSHFDQRWIRHHMPSITRRLTWWTYDVGVMRRMVRSVSPDAVYRDGPEEKAHRGLDDAIDHLDEWRHYRDVLAVALDKFDQIAKILGEDDQ